MTILVTIRVDHVGRMEGQEDYGLRIEDEAGHIIDHVRAGAARDWRQFTLHGGKELHLRVTDARDAPRGRSGESLPGVLTPPEGDVARPCCGEYFTCQRPCTPRGEQRAYRGADEELRLKVDAIVEWIDSMAGEELSSEERWPSIVRSVRSQVQGLVSPPSADATDATAVHSQVNSET